MKSFLNQILLLTVLTSASALAQSQVAPAETRGQLLYTTHCISCHTTQMHWREDKRATDWQSLKGQVRRWQANASLQWSDSDINEVARYLNDSIYRYPQTADRVSLVQGDLMLEQHPAQEAVQLRAEMQKAKKAALINQRPN